MISQSEFQEIVAAGDPIGHGFFVLLGGLAGGTYLVRDSREWPLDPRSRGLFMLWVHGFALVGASLPARVAGGVIGERALSSWIVPKTITGALIFGFLGAVVAKRILGIRHDTSDAFARSCGMLMTIGRIGCWFQHCCFGVPWPGLGVDLGDGRERFPVQILEFAGLALLTRWIFHLHAQNLHRHRRLFLFFTGYGILRFGLEPLREPIASAPHGIGIYQWLSLALVGIGGYQLIKRRDLQAT